jgi:hypothetical protein
MSEKRKRTPKREAREISTLELYAWAFVGAAMAYLKGKREKEGELDEN